MDRSRLVPRICFVVTAGLALLGALLRSLALLTSYDNSIGYFDPGLLPTLSNISFAVAALCAVLWIFLTPKGSPASTLHTPLYKPVACLMGAALAFFTIAAFILCYPLKKGDLLLAPVVLGLLGSTYYFIAAFTIAHREDGRAPDWLSAIGFLPLLWGVASLAETYTDRYVAMNSPIKLSLHLALIGFLLIITTELRYRLGKPLPRLALAFLSMGVVFCLSGALPVLVATGAKVLADPPHALYASVLVVAGLYGAYLLFSLVQTLQITVNATVPQPCETEAQPDDENADYL